MLFQGISYTTSTQSIPSLLALPSASAAYYSFQQHKESTKRHLSALLAVSVTSYSLAFALSPPRGGRHPYLLWTSLVATIGWGTAQYLVKNNDAELLQSVAAAKDPDEESYIDAAGSSSTSDLGAITELNGEEVRKAMENWRFTEVVRGGVTGLAFFMGVVGIWGDGTGVRQAVAA